MADRLLDAREREGATVSKHVTVVPLGGDGPKSDSGSATRTRVVNKALRGDLSAYPEFSDAIRKIHCERPVTDEDLLPLVRKFQADPAGNLRLFDIILDSLNPKIAEILNFLAGSQETLQYHVGTQAIVDQKALDRDASMCLATFFRSSTNRDDRHPHLGKSSLFFLAPYAIKQLLLAFPGEQSNLLDYIANNFPQRLMECLYADVSANEKVSADEGSVLQVLTKNQRAREFLAPLAPRFGLPAGEHGELILFHEVAQIYDLIFRKHWFPLIRHRGQIIDESALWDAIIEPIVLEFAEQYESLNPLVLDKRQTTRRYSFSYLFRTFATKAATDRFNAILREFRKTSATREDLDPELFQDTDPDHNPQATAEAAVESAAALRILEALSPRTRQFWESYQRQRQRLQAESPNLKRIEGRVFQMVAEELNSTLFHARNKVHEVKKLFVAADLLAQAKPRGKAARAKG